MENLAKILGVEFENDWLIQQALTHASVANKPHYERLEFLGDRVLNLAVADMLFENFPKEEEGTMAKRHAALVRQEALVKIAEVWQVSELLYLSSGEKRSGGNQKPSILADVIESILAVVYLEKGFDEASRIVKQFWEPLIDKVQIKDAKSHLQEFLQGKSLPLPVYSTVKEEGEAHKMMFTMQVQAEEFGSAQGRAGSKQQAEQAAAEQLLKNIGER